MSITIYDKKGRVNYLIGISPPDVEYSIEDPFKRVYKLPDLSGMSQEELKVLLLKELNEAVVLEPASYVVRGWKPDDEIWVPDNEPHSTKLRIWFDKLMNKLRQW